MEKYLQLTPQQFDQDKNGGWRIIYNQGTIDYIMSDKQNCSKILEAIDMMKYYIDHYQFQEDEYYMQQLIRFHVGQLYADVGDYISALKYFIGLHDEGYDKVGVEYLDFTINFLQGNIDVCETIVTGLPADGSTINTETVQRMIEYKDCSYLEAYSGMKGDEMKQWIIENKL